MPRSYFHYSLNNKNEWIINISFFMRKINVPSRKNTFKHKYNHSMLNLIIIITITEE